MALESQKQTVDLTFGINRETDVDSAQGRGALDLQNFDFNADGVLTRRPGIRATNVAALQGLTSPRAFVSASGATGVLDQRNLTYDVERWTDYFPGEAVLTVNMARGGGFLCLVTGTRMLGANGGSSDNYAVYVTLLDESTKTLVYETRIGDTHHPKVVSTLNALHPVFHITYLDESGTMSVVSQRLSYLSGWNLSAPATLAPTAGVPGGQYSGYDLATDNSRIFIATVYATTVITFEYSLTGTLVTTCGDASTAPGTSLDVWCVVTGNGGNQALCTYFASSGTSTFRCIYNTIPIATVPTSNTVIATGTPAVGQVAAAGASGNRQLVAWGYNSQVYWATVTATTVTDSNSQTDVRLISGGLRRTIGSDTYLLVALCDLQTSTTAYLMALSDNPSGTATRVLGTLLFEQLQPPDPVSNFVFDVIRLNAALLADGDEVWTVLPSVLELLPTGLGSNGQYVARATVLRAAPDEVVPSVVMLGDTAFVSGSFPLAWDGVDFYPAAFPTTPRTPVVTTSGTGLTGVYTFRAVTEYTDRHGNLLASFPSDQVSITLANQGVNVRVAVQTVWTRYSRDPIAASFRFKLYRTLAGGSSFFLSKMTDLPFAAELSIFDNQSDATIQSNEELVVDTSTLLPESAPPAAYLASHRNRLFAVQPGSDEIRFTAEVVPPRAPLWNAILAFRVTNDGGLPLALASLSDKLLVFQRDQICVVTGEGPDGVGNGYFGLPEVIARGVGVEPGQEGSVVRTPNGVMFSHRTGIYLIGNDLAVVPIGRALGDKNVGLDFPIRRARHLPVRAQTWFTSDGNGIFVFDHRLGRWTQFVGYWNALHDILEQSAETVLSLFNATNTTYYWDPAATSDTVAVDEDQGTRGFWTQVLGMPWFRVDRTREVRLRRLLMSFRKDDQGDNACPAVTLEVFEQNARTNQEVATQTFSWTASQVATWPEFQLIPARAVTRRCRAFRCRLTLSWPTAIDVDLFPSSVTYEYGITTTDGKAPSANKPTAS